MGVPRYALVAQRFMYSLQAAPPHKHASCESAKLQIKKYLPRIVIPTTSVTAITVLLATQRTIRTIDREDIGCTG